MIRKISLLFLILVHSPALLAAVWYAAPNASANGNGSIAQPWTLQTALTKTTVVQPGDTIYLRGGNYRGPGFRSTIAGASNNYVTVRSYPHEWAVVTDGVFGVLRTNLLATSADVVNVPISGFETLPILPVLLIGSETIYVVGRTGTNWNLVRGWNGSTITAHKAGDPVLLVMDIIYHTGSYVTFRDFEITALGSTNRIVGTTNFLGSGLNLSSLGHGNKAINLIVHNTGHPGIGFWQQGVGGEINGCLLWGIGQYDYSGNFGGEPRGSAVYSQNVGGTAIIKNIISFRNFTSGGKVFGETGPVKDFKFLSNIVFQAAPSEPTLAASSGSTSTSNIWFDGNVMLGTPMLAYVSISNRAEYFINNTIVSGHFYTGDHADSFYTNNTVFMPKGVGAGAVLIGYVARYFPSNALNNVWDYNRYYLGDGSSRYNWFFSTTDVNPANALGGGNLRFNNDSGKSWQDWSGYDTHSSYQEGWPTNYLKISVQRSDYDSNRWHIAVVSTSSQTNTTIALSDYGFANGQHYQLVDAQNWPVVVASGAYDGGAINLPLNLTNVSIIPGVKHFTNEHTNVRSLGLFNTFVLQRISAIAPPTNVRFTP